MLLSNIRKKDKILFLVSTRSFLVTLGKTINFNTFKFLTFYNDYSLNSKTTFIY